jgi:hypothetical protein
MSGPRPGDAPLGQGRAAWLLVGALAIVGGTLLGWNGTLLTLIATPPPFVRAFLVGLSAVAALWCVVQAVRRLEAGRSLDAAAVPGEPGLSGRDLASLIRGVRFVFLAVAALSAGVGWLVGHPLPFVVALVIAGVDILETTFLLVVVALRREP